MLKIMVCAEGADSLTRKRMRLNWLLKVGSKFDTHSLSTIITFRLRNYSSLSMAAFHILICRAEGERCFKGEERGLPEPEYQLRSSSR
jgi:hypothetical protein